jgi:hypothetical protein
MDSGYRLYISRTREEQLDCAMQAILSMHGDVQGMAGKTLRQTEGLEAQRLLDLKTEE